MRAKTNYLLGVGVLLFSTLLHAQDSLTDFYDDDTLQRRVLALSGESGSYTQTQDLSTHFLKMLFGTISTLDGYNMIIGKVFELFNLGLLGIVSFIVGYTILTSVIGSAQDSGGAFSTRVSPWTLARTSTGVTIMFPMTSGYSLVQTMVMKVVLLGIAFANTGWNATLAHFSEKGGSFEVTQTQQRVLDQHYNNTKRAFVMLVDAFPQVYAQKHECIKAGYCDNRSLVTDVQFKGGRYQVTYSNPFTIDDQAYDINIDLFYSSVPDNHDELLTNAMRSVFNSLLQVARSHEREKSPELDNAIRGIGNREFAALYSCPGAKNRSGTFRYDKNCVDEKGTDFARLSERRNELLTKMAEQARVLASFAKVIPVDTAKTLEADWVKNAKASGWLSAGIFYGKLMDFDSGEEASVNTKIFKFNNAYLQNEIQPFLNPDLDQEASEVPYYVGDQPRVDSGPGIRKSGQQEIADRIVEGFRELRKYTVKNSPQAFALIPNLSGKTGKNAWIYGVDPTKPIQNFAVMVGRVVQQLIGYQFFTDNMGEEGLGNAIQSGCGGEDFRVSDDCYVPGSMVHGLVYPDKIVNPIHMIRNLGKTMMQQSVYYYSKTIKDLFGETKRLADSHFGVTSTVSAVATATEALTAAGPAAPAGTAVGTAAEVTLSGLKIAFNGTKIAMEMFVPIGTAAAGVFFSLGVILAVYIPMLPFVLFLFGAVAWLMSVTEAMVAAPLVALGMTHPEGHDLLGKSEQALILLLGVFIRPITMLFGILFAIIVSQILVKLFHLSFGSMAITVLFSGVNGTEEPMTHLAVAAGGTLLVYVYILITVIEQSFSLIYVIPERILRWIGGPQDQTGIGQLADKTKGEAQQAAGNVQGADVSGPNVSATDGRISSPDRGGDGHKGNDVGDANNSVGAEGSGPNGTDSTVGASGPDNTESTAGEEGSGPGGTESTVGEEGSGPGGTENTVGGEGSSSDTPTRTIGGVSEGEQDA